MNIKHRYKMLPLTFPFLCKRRIWEECLTTEKQITPTFHRNGYYYDRHTRQTWLEIEGEAWTYREYESFKYTLLISEGNNYMSDTIMQSLEILITWHIATPQQREMYQIQRDRVSIHNAGRNARINGMQMSKRLAAYRRIHNV